MTRTNQHFQLAGRCAFLLVALAASQLAAQDLAVLPETGKFAGFAASKVPGKWLVFGPGGFRPVFPTVLENGEAVVWQGDPGEYAVILIPPGDGQPIVTVVVLAGQAPPVPPPLPDLTGLAKQIHDWATTLVPSDALLKCDALAQSFDSIASQMAAGALTDPAKVISSTASANAAAAGEQRSAWLPFFEQLRSYLNAESKAGRLKTIEQHIVAWREIVIGLRAVQ